MITEESLRLAIGEATTDFSNSHKCKVTKEFAFKAGANHLAPALLVLADYIRCPAACSCGQPDVIGPCTDCDILTQAANLLQIDWSAG